MSLIEFDTQETQTHQPLWSSYQMDIFNAIQDPDGGNLLIEAVAGSGKTTTILQALDLIPPQDKAIFVAFNRSIADELKLKVPFNVKAKTLHSTCCEVLRSNKVKYEIQKNKNLQLLTKQLSSSLEDVEFANEFGGDICRFISKIKGGFIHVPSRDAFDQIYYRSDLILPNSKFARDVIYATLTESYEFKSGYPIDFDDMLRLPLVLDGINWTQYSWVFVDEAQDLNAVQRLVVQALCKRGGRVVAVGDTNQAIYAFRGADHDSMKLLKNEFSMRELPLSISYRCSSSVVEAARVFVPQISASGAAPQGIVNSISKAEMLETVDDRSHILCRTTAPLVQVALQLGLRNNNVCVLGKSVTWGVLHTAKRIASTQGVLCRDSVREFYKNMAVEFDRQPGRLAVIEDRCMIIGYCLPQHGVLSLADLRATLGSIFTDKPSPNSVILSTVHKAKGLEADKIYIIRPDLIPHPLAEHPHELQQEANIHYVAITRAKKELYYVQ